MDKFADKITQRRIKLHSGHEDDTLTYHSYEMNRRYLITYDGRPDVSKEAHPGLSKRKRAKSEFQLHDFAHLIFRRREILHVLTRASSSFWNTYHCEQSSNHQNEIRFMTSIPTNQGMLLNALIFPPDSIIFEEFNPETETGKHIIRLGNSSIVAYAANGIQSDEVQSHITMVDAIASIPNFAALSSSQFDRHVINSLRVGTSQEWRTRPGVNAFLTQIRLVVPNTPDVPGDQ